MFKKKFTNNYSKSKPVGMACLTAAVFFAVLAMPLHPVADEPGATKGLHHSFHVGATYPVGSFDHTADANVHCRFDFTYPLTDKLFVTLFGGFSQFTDDYSTKGYHPYWFNLSTNIKFLLFTTPSGVSYYVQAGPGIYFPKPVSALPNTLGANVGYGTMIPVSSRLKLDWGIDLHCTHLGKSGDNPRFWFLTMQLGMLYKW